MKAKVGVSGDVSGISGWAASVGGILDAVEHPGFQGDFAQYTLEELRKKFRTDTIAAYQSGVARLHHVFDWPSQGDSGVSNGIKDGNPLFRLNIRGSGDRKYMDFSFLPSTRYVPLPDPSRYGFKPSKLRYLKRHKFVQKAIIMETQSRVVVRPKGDNKLFIPTEDSPRGYVMTSKAVNINPGGNSTGGFSEWWNQWFGTVAQIHVNEISGSVEEEIKKTGQKVFRDLKGRFASGRSVSIGTVNAQRRVAYLQMRQSAKRKFRGDVDV